MGVRDDFSRDQRESRQAGGSGDPDDEPADGGGGADTGGGEPTDGFTGGGSGSLNDDDDRDVVDRFVGGVEDDRQRDRRESRQTRPAPEPEPDPAGGGGGGGREATPGTEPPTTVDGRETTLLGPEAPLNPTDEPLAAVTDRSGDAGEPATPAGDDPLVPDAEAPGVEDRFGQLAGPEEGPVDDAVSGLEARISRQVEGTISTERENFNLRRQGDQVRATLTDQGLAEADRGGLVAGLPTVRRDEAVERQPDRGSPAGGGAVLGGIGPRPGFRGGTRDAGATIPLVGARDDAVEDTDEARQAGGGLARAAATRSLREQGFDPAAFEIGTDAQGQPEVDLRTPGEFDASAGLFGPGDEVEQFLDETLPGAVGSAAAAVGLDRVREEVATPGDDAPETEVPERFSDQFGRASDPALVADVAFETGEELVQLPGTALEVAEAGALVAGADEQGPDGESDVPDRFGPEGPAEVAGERLAPVAAALGTGARRSAEESPRRFTTSLLIGSAAETAAFSAAGRAARVDAPEVDTELDPTAALGEARTRAPDVDVVEDRDAGLVEVSPLLSRQARDAVRERLPDGAANTGSRDVFGRPASTEFGPLITGDVSRSSDVFGRGAARSVGEEPVTARVADLLPEGEAGTTSRDVFGRPLSVEAPGQLSREIATARAAVADRLPEGEPGTTTADVFGRPGEGLDAASRELTAVADAVAGEADTTADEVFGSPFAFDAARDDVARARDAVGSFARAVEEPLQTGSRDTFGRPLSSEGFDVLPSAGEPTTRDEVFGAPFAFDAARDDVARARDAGDSLARALEEPTDTDSRDVFGRPLSSEGFDVLPSGGGETTTDEVFGRPRAPGVSLRVGPIRPERVDAEGVPDDGGALGPFADEDVEGFAPFGEVVDGGGAAGGRATAGDARVDAGDGTQLVARRDRREVDSPDAPARPLPDRGSQRPGPFGFGALAGAVTDPAERGLRSLGAAEAQRVTPGVSTDRFGNAGLDDGVGAGFSVTLDGDGRQADRLGTDTVGRFGERVDDRFNTRVETGVDTQADSRLDRETETSTRLDGRRDLRTEVPPARDEDDDSTGGLAFGVVGEQFTNPVAEVDEFLGEAFGTDNRR